MIKTSTTYTRGVTFIEMIVMLSVFVIAITVIASSVSFFYRTNREAVEQSLALESARRGVEALVRDVREATFSDTGSFPIESIDPYEFVFYSDTDLDDNVERIHYYLNGTTFIRGITEPAGSPPSYDSLTETISLVSDDVQNADQGMPVFSYFDESGAEITDYNNINDVSFVTINLIVNVDPLDTASEFTVRSSATIRNLKTNL